MRLAPHGRGHELKKTPAMKRSRAIWRVRAPPTTSASAGKATRKRAVSPITRFRAGGSSRPKYPTTWKGRYDLCKYVANEARASHAPDGSSWAHVTFSTPLSLSTATQVHCCAWQKYAADVAEAKEGLQRLSQNIGVGGCSTRVLSVELRNFEGGSAIEAPGMDLSSGLWLNVYRCSSEAEAHGGDDRGLHKGSFRNLESSWESAVLQGSHTLQESTV